MKKTYQKGAAFLVVIALMISLASCSQGQTAESSSTESVLSSSMVDSSTPVSSQIASEVSSEEVSSAEAASKVVSSQKTNSQEVSSKKQPTGTSSKSEAVSSAVDSKPAEPVIEDLTGPTLKHDKKSIRILAIGNSFSDDAMYRYLPSLLKSGGYQEIELGIMYIGGSSLDQHWDNMQGDKNAYTYYILKNGEWMTLPSGIKLGTAFSDTAPAWDYITIQQVSSQSGKPDTYTNLSNITARLKELAPQAKILWHMTWSYENGTPDIANGQMGMYEAISKTVQDVVLKNESIVGVIPSGTAVQNARTTDLNEKKGALTKRDDVHLDDKYGDYLAALTWYCYFSGENANTVTYRPVGYFDQIAKSVNNAINNPYQRTFCE